MNIKLLSLVSIIPFALLMEGCASRPQSVKDSAPKHSVNIRKIPNAKPKIEPKSRYGNPDNYTVNGQRYQVASSAKGYKERGMASWYGMKFHKKRTSSGEPYDVFKMTAAHTSLPLPTYAKVTHLGNGRHVIVKINDRGPFHDNRILDLSYVAAKKLGIANEGTAYVEVEAIDLTRKNYLKSDPIQQPDRAKVFIQLGAFSDLNSAKDTRSKLESHLRRPVHIDDTKTIPRIYRVRVGPFSDPSVTEDLLKRVASLGYQSYVVKG